MSTVAIEASDQTQRIFYALEGAGVHKCGWFAGHYPDGSTPVVLSAQQCENYASEAERKDGSMGVVMSSPCFDKEERSIARRTPGGVEVVGMWFSYSSADGLPGEEAVAMALDTLNKEVVAQRGNGAPLQGPLCNVLQGESGERTQLLLAIPITYAGDSAQETGTVSEPTALLVGGGKSSRAALTFTAAKELGKRFSEAHVLFVVPTVPFHLAFNGEDFALAKKKAVRALVSDRLRGQGRFWLMDGAGEKKQLLSPTTCGEGDVNALLSARATQAASSSSGVIAVTAGDAASQQKAVSKTKKTAKKGKGGAKKKKKGGGGASKLLLAQQEALSAVSGTAVAVESTSSPAEETPARVVELYPVGSLSPTEAETNGDSTVTVSPSSASYELLVRVQAAWYCPNGSSLEEAVELGLATFAYAAEDAVDQINQPGKCIVKDCIDGQSRELTQDRVPTTLFFSPAKYYAHAVLGNFLLSPSEPNEDYLLRDRARLHSTFMLPENTPLFRTCNSKALVPRLAASLDSGGRLCNVHEGLPSHVEGGAQFLVDGTYEYYHYLQDRLDDNGWGCAYRSMQTICSWIRHQSYSDAAVPHHRRIQEALVAMNDKPANFVGSSQWIGAFEISLCLDYFYGISCKIINCSSGDDIKDHARELSVHFSTNGSPVMIGGGVLAYTLLGIDWNEKTGDIRFLILDPHYIGSENLEAIQRLGWCNWKESSLFRSDAFYNLCMPQRPRMI